jgi:ABC-type thiamine transport system ATPase subunit/GNAT superfamily N-acetyltransferase
MRVDLDLEVDIKRTPRVQQIEGMFDVQEKARDGVSFHFDVPLEEKPWSVGLIVGPSGAGKSSCARALFGKNLVDGYPWKPGAAIVDGFGDISIKEITKTLSNVGFSSPPAWLKPFSVLSNGERFRVNLARAILDPRPLVAVDEFSSVVDRVVARIGSHAAARTVRATKGKQLVAVTCHEDVIDWLQPDWVLEPHVGTFSWRAPQRRPGVTITITRANTSAWRFFKRHHYLTASIHAGATCFVAWVEGQPVAFDAWLPFVGRTSDGRMGRRGHRTVCLPDYQGVGIGNTLFEFVASLWSGLGYHAYSCTGHPAEIVNRMRTGKWRMSRKPGFTTASGGALAENFRSTRSNRRRTASFEYIGPKMPEDLAEAILADTVTV